MEKTEYGRMLRETAQKIFEEAAFALVDPPEDDGTPFGECGTGSHSVSVTFSGAFSGTLAMLSTRSLATLFAANMLGVDEDDPAAENKNIDAVKEILNMICGNFLSEAAGVEPEFRIEAPEMIKTGDFERLSSAAEAVTARLYVENCIADLVLVINA